MRWKPYHINLLKEKGKNKEKEKAKLKKKKKFKKRKRNAVRRRGRENDERCAGLFQSFLYQKELKSMLRKDLTSKNLCKFEFLIIPYIN